MAAARNPLALNARVTCRSPAKVSRKATVGRGWPNTFKSKATAFASRMGTWLHSKHRNTSALESR
eukprot:11063180-Alexandrium_andersonii.AAC.1